MRTEPWTPDTMGADQTTHLSRRHCSNTVYRWHMEWGPDLLCAQDSPALLLETDCLKQTYNLVAVDLQISHVVART